MRKLKNVCAVLLTAMLALSAASAQQRPATSVDLFALTPVPAANSVVYLDINTKTVASQVIDLTKKNLILIAAGQSNFEDVAPSAYTATNAANIGNLNIYDDVIYNGTDPFLGTTQLSTNVGHPANRIADALITNGKFDRVIIVPIAVSGTLVADWDTGFASNRFAVTFKRLAQRGIVAGSNVTIVVLWGQGESDNANGTSQATYTAELNDVIAQTRAAGFNGTWFVAEQTYIIGAASAAIQAAQAAVVSHGAGVWAGPNADALVGNVCGPSANAACRQADQTHWVDNGSYSYAAAWVTALHAFGAPF